MYPRVSAIGYVVEMMLIVEMVHSVTLLPATNVSYYISQKWLHHIKHHN